jgi:hypothetical protein
VGEDRVERAVLEVGADALHRARVGVPQPAEADDADPDLAAFAIRALYHWTVAIVSTC